jgi:hypothetical protein
MIRQRVDNLGILSPLEPAAGLRSCNLPKEQIGWPKEIALKGWFEHRKKDEVRFASQKEKGEQLVLLQKKQSIFSVKT